MNEEEAKAFINYSQPSSAFMIENECKMCGETIAREYGKERFVYIELECGHGVCVECIKRSI